MNWLGRGAKDSELACYGLVEWDFESGVAVDESGAGSPGCFARSLESVRCPGRGQGYMSGPYNGVLPDCI